MQGSVFTGILLREPIVWWNANMKIKLGSSIFCCFIFKNVLWYLHHKKDWHDKIVVSQKLTNLLLQSLFSRNYRAWQVQRCERRNKHKKKLITAVIRFMWLKNFPIWIIHPTLDSHPALIQFNTLFLHCISLLEGDLFSSNLWYT